MVNPKSYSSEGLTVKTSAIKLLKRAIEKSKQDVEEEYELLPITEWLESHTTKKQREALFINTTVDIIESIVWMVEHGEV